MADIETPKPTTAIPELVAVPLSDDEFKTVVDAMELLDGLLVNMLRHKGGASRNAHFNHTILPRVCDAALAEEVV